MQKLFVFSLILCEMLWFSRGHSVSSSLSYASSDLIRSRARNALLGVFVSDAASVGLHWIYDQSTIQHYADQHDGQVEFADPATNNPYHKNVKLGGLSHYGETALVSLKAMVELGTPEDANGIRASLVQHFTAPDYNRYLDHATKELIAKGGFAPSTDNQNGANARSAAIAVYAALKSDAEFDRLIQETIKVTHDDGDVEGSALPFSSAAAWALRKVLQDGLDVEESLESIVGEYAELTNLPVKERVVPRLEQAQEAVSKKTPQEFGKEVGQHCRVPNSFQVSSRILLDSQFETFQRIIREEILVGGDSSGRLLISGAIAGASYGVPEDWLNRLNDKDQIVELVDAWIEQAGL